MITTKQGENLIMIKQSDIISVRNTITNEEYKMMSDNIQIKEVNGVDIVQYQPKRRLLQDDANANKRQYYSGC